MFHLRLRAPGYLSATPVRFLRPPRLWQPGRANHPRRWNSGHAGPQHLLGSSGPPRDPSLPAHLPLPPPFSSSSSSSLSESLLESPVPGSLLLLLWDSLSDSGSVEETCQASPPHVKTPPPVRKALRTGCRGLSGSVEAPDSELKLQLYLTCPDPRCHPRLQRHGRTPTPKSITCTAHTSENGHLGSCRLRLIS